MHQDLAQEQATTLSRTERLQTTLNVLQTAFHEHQTEIQNQLTHLTTTQQDHQQTVDITIQHLEQEAQQRFLVIEQRVTDSLKHLEQTFTIQLNALTETLARTQQSSEDTRQRIAVREHSHDLALSQIQTQLDQYKQLFPLLPHVQALLASEQDRGVWAQTFATQQRELERYQPLLALLSSERLKILIQDQDTRDGKNGNIVGGISDVL